MLLLTWHGTLVTRPDFSGALRHVPLAADDLAGALDVDVPDAAHGASLRHAELGMLRLETAPEDGAISLLRDGLYLCADGHTGHAMFDRPSAASWESFLPLSQQDAAGLGFVLQTRWIVRKTRQVIRRSQIGLCEGFRLRVGPYEVDLAASIGTLVARWRDGQPAAITLTDEGTGVELVVAEPRGSALVHTELWPPRARRFAEILTFAAHRHVAGLEPSQADFERDVAFLRERQGAAGLEDLLEKMMDESAAAAMAEEPSEAVFEAGLATVKTHVEAARTGLAKEALERLIAAFPNVAQLWFRLGDMHHDAAAYGAAQSAWERCLALAPSHDAAAS
jgi:hypothetical protein